MAQFVLSGLSEIVDEKTFQKIVDCFDDIGVFDQLNLMQKAYNNQWFPKGTHSSVKFKIANLENDLIKTRSLLFNNGVTKKDRALEDFDIGVNEKNRTILIPKTKLAQLIIANTHDTSFSLNSVPSHQFEKLNQEFQIQRQNIDNLMLRNQQLIQENQDLKQRLESNFEYIRSIEKYTQQLVHELSEAESFIENQTAMVSGLAKRCGLEVVEDDEPIRKWKTESNLTSHVEGKNDEIGAHAEGKGEFTEQVHHDQFEEAILLEDDTQSTDSFSSFRLSFGVDDVMMEIDSQIEREFVRDLTREGIEPNPGPAFFKFFIPVIALLPIYIHSMSLRHFYNEDYVLFSENDSPFGFVGLNRHYSTVRVLKWDTCQFYDILDDTSNKIIYRHEFTSSPCINSNCSCSFSTVSSTVNRVFDRRPYNVEFSYIQNYHFSSPIRDLQCYEIRDGVRYTKLYSCLSKWKHINGWAVPQVYFTYDHRKKEDDFIPDLTTQGIEPNPGPVNFIKLYILLTATSSAFFFNKHDYLNTWMNQRSCPSTTPSYGPLAVYGASESNSTYLQKNHLGFRNTLSGCPDLSRPISVKYKSQSYIIPSSPHGHNNFQSYIVGPFCGNGIILRCLMFHDQWFSIPKHLQFSQKGENIVFNNGLAKMFQLESAGWFYVSAGRELFSGKYHIECRVKNHLLSKCNHDTFIYSTENYVILYWHYEIIA